MHKQPHSHFTDLPVRPLHSTDNRLARRLFQLEERVGVLEEQVQDMTSLIETLFGFDSIETEHEFGISFCRCDDDDEDDEDEDD